MVLRTCLLLLPFGELHAQSVPLFEVKPTSPRFQALPLGEVKASGWLKHEIERNLNGFTGRLDSLAPDLILEDDIFASNRIKLGMKTKNLGALSDGGAWQVQFLWWNSETQGNWLDGLLRSAVIVQNKQALEKAAAFARHILQSQDADGYLGIYDPSLRYRFDNENGELWGKTTILRFLLAWYANQKEPAVLHAIERAVKEVMDSWPAYRSKPFFSVNPNVGGLSHGLMFTDVLLDLYLLTGNRQYLDYGVFLYEDFSRYDLNEDAQLHKLLDENLKLKGHGVHAYEHLRSVAFASHATGHPQLRQALERYIEKVRYASTPSGAPAGDEFVGARQGDAWHTGYEFCSLHELMHGWIRLMQWSGKASFGQAAEKILFNAALGATHPDMSAICYLKTDNSYMLVGGKHGDTTDPNQTRYRYSPVHKEAAVCCVPNAGRIFPYFLQHMWMKDAGGLVASLLGPSELSTTHGGEPVQITAETSYPFDSVITYRVRLKKPMAFSLKVRKPEGVLGFSVSVPYTESDGFIHISRTWKNGDAVAISFSMPPRVIDFSNGREVYVQSGPLVLCRPVAAQATTTRSFGAPHLQELVYKPLEPEQPTYTLSNGTGIQSASYPRCEVRLWDAGNQRWETTLLQPMAGTVLRQVTFKKRPFTAGFEQREQDD